MKKTDPKGIWQIYFWDDKIRIRYRRLSASLKNNTEPGFLVLPKISGCEEFYPLHGCSGSDRNYRVDGVAKTADLFLCYIHCHKISVSQD